MCFWDMVCDCCLCLPCYRWGCTFTFLLRMTEFYVYAGFIARLLDMNIISYSDNNIGLFQKIRIHPC